MMWFLEKVLQKESFIYDIIDSNLKRSLYMKPLDKFIPEMLSDENAKRILSEKQYMDFSMMSVEERDANLRELLRTS